jgi:hypothetical protein
MKKDNKVKELVATTFTMEELSEAEEISNRIEEIVQKKYSELKVHDIILWWLQNPHLSELQ